MGVESKPDARTQVLDSLASVFSVNPELVAGTVVFLTMIDGSVLVLYTSCCLKHAAQVAQTGLSQAAETVGWDCPRER